MAGSSGGLPEGGVSSGGGSGEGGVEVVLGCFVETFTLGERQLGGGGTSVVIW